MTPNLLPPDRLRWIGVRFRDPNGRTFEFEGGIYRAIYPDKVARSMIREGGLYDAEYRALSPQPERILRAAPAIYERARLAGGSDLLQQRRRHLEIAREHLPASFPVISKKWTGYDKSGALPANYDGLGPRRAAILAIMQKLRPRQVIDLASNSGFFSFMAARQGAEVFAVDYDEGAIEKLYELARGCGERISVTSACADLTRPNPVKPQAELVLALALTHHLSLSQHFPFAHIAENLVGYCTRALIVEYMPNGLGGVRVKPDPLPEWYTLEKFMEAFRRHFQSVEVVTYPAENASPRTMVLCDGKKQPPA